MKSREGEIIKEWWPDITSGYLINKYGWFRVEYHGEIINTDIIDWFRENNINEETDIRLIETVSVFFRKENDAVAFKLTWT